MNLHTGTERLLTLNTNMSGYEAGTILVMAILTKHMTAGVKRMTFRLLTRLTGSCCKVCCSHVFFSAVQNKMLCATFEKRGAVLGSHLRLKPFNYISDTMMKRQLTRLK